MPKKANASNSTLSIFPEESSNLDLVRFEKNLLQSGFFASTNVLKGSEKSRRRIEQEVTRDGTLVKASIEFKIHESIGLPTTSDRDKFFAFLKIVEEEKARRGVIKNPIYFTGYRMIKELGMSPTGKIYDEIAQWGERMTGTMITSESFVYLSAKKAYTTDTLHVFSKFRRGGVSDLDGGNRKEGFEVYLEEWFIENLNQRYVIPHDFAAYKRLERPTAKGIFSLLHVWFHASGGRPVEKDYFNLCTLLGVTPYAHVSKIKGTMGQSLDELVSIGYLAKWDVQRRLTKTGYKIILYAGPQISNLSRVGRKQLTQSVVSPKEKAAISALETSGIRMDKAHELVSICGVDAVLDTVEYIEDQVQRKTGNKIENPAGLIIYYLENNVSIPESFVGSRQLALLQAQKSAELEKQREQHRQQVLYLEWKDKNVQESLDAQFTQETLEAKIKEVILQKMRVDRRYRDFSQEIKRNIAMTEIRKEVIGSAALPSFEEWLAGKSQYGLFL